jgi:ribose-phosphate pyrophosphokinase
VLANLLTVAGVDHVITVDLHASQMQGFFTKPVDNLYAEPLLARWIRHNVPNWRESVVVSKNPGGTKRVTQLADVLKLNFALITTDRRRINRDGWASSRFQSHRHSPAESVDGDGKETTGAVDGAGYDETVGNTIDFGTTPRASAPIAGLGISTVATNSPSIGSTGLSNGHQSRAEDEEDDDEYADDHAHSVIYGRLISGHIVDDDYPSPSPSMAASTSHGDEQMMSSIHSLPSLHPADNALGGSIDADNSDDEDEADRLPGSEKMITLVGDVRNRTVLIVDDMIDRPGSWIAAAEHVKLRGGAKKVICIATHGVFGGDCLREMEDCSCIDQIVVTNSFPIPEEERRGLRKLTIIDLSQLLSEAIRRNHHGMPISNSNIEFY